MNKSLNFGVVCLFPEMLQALDYGITHRAMQKGLLQIHTVNPRDYSTDKHQSVDDRPYGGGPGMVLKADVLQRAVHATKQTMPNAKTVYLSPAGKPIDQALLMRACAHPNWLLIAGRYEGVDERFIESEVDEQWSLGDFVLSGGELAAMSVIDGMTRLLPEALGHNESAQQDSFMQGLLDCPHYTRPEVLNQQTVPPVLLSGDHQAIAAWRKTQALGRTWLYRPDLLQKRDTSAEEFKLLQAFKRAYWQKSRSK